MKEDSTCRRTQGIKPLFVENDGTLWVSRSYEILRSRDHGASFERVAGYSPRPFHRVCSSFRLADRLMRTGFHALIPLENGDLLGVVKNHIVLCPKGDSGFRIVFDVPRGSRPLNLCVVPGGKIYFGEYFSNPERDAVNIYASEDDGHTWSVVFTFPKGSIRHIHGIYYDPFRAGCWILTGDSDRECKIMFAEDHFRNVDVVLEGGQSHRAVGIIPLKDGLIVPMDSELSENYIQWLDTGDYSLRKVFRLQGSALGAGRAGEYLLVSTAVEPSGVNAGNEATIYLSKNGMNWLPLYTKRKDVYPSGLFQYGSFGFPCGENPGKYIYAYACGLAGADNHMLSWARECLSDCLPAGID